MAKQVAASVAQGVVMQAEVEVAPTVATLEEVVKGAAQAEAA